MTGSPFHEKWPWRRDAEGRTALEIVPRWLRWGLAAAMLGVAALWLGINAVGHDPARWHVDPAEVARTGKPNDYLVAPDGATAARPDRPSPVWPLNPQALLARLDRLALAEARTERVAGSPEDEAVTYVVRSAVFGFPDYVSVRAVDAPGGAQLILWSRSRYGYADLGVNRARAERWLAALEPG